MDLTAQVQIWRQKAAAGQLSQDEMKEAIQALRQGRIAASAASAASGAKKAAKVAKASVNSDDLLNQLEGL